MSDGIDTLDMRWPLLAARVYNAPLMIHPEKAAVIEAVLRSHAGGKPVIEAAQYAESAERKPYRVTVGGTAVIPVMGTLVNRGGWLDAMSGITSYQRIATQLDQALADRDVRSILLEIDSPGGEAHGVFDLSNKLMAARAQKPLWAMADGDAFSAAYAIASAAEKVYIARTGMAGSIGVIAMHFDQSVKLEKAGMKYTAIIAGDKKADFASHQPLSDRARATMQHMVDDMYSLFVSSVAAARNLSEQAVRDTQAGVYTAPEAQRVGLIDGIATLDEVVAELERHTRASQSIFTTRASARTQSQRRPTMSETTHGTGADTTPVITHADIDRARADGIVAGRAEGAKAERDRIGAILAHAEASGREAQARTLALETELSAEQAGKVLAASPKQVVATAQGSAFAAAMAAQGNPDVAPGIDGGDQQTDATAEAARCVELFQGGRRK